MKLPCYLPEGSSRNPLGVMKTTESAGSDSIGLIAQKMLKSSVINVRRVRPVIGSIRSSGP